MVARQAPARGPGASVPHEASGGSSEPLPAQWARWDSETCCLQFQHGRAIERGDAATGKGLPIGKLLLYIDGGFLSRLLFR